MIKFILAPIMRPIARHKLKDLYDQRSRFEQTIKRARGSKQKVSHLYTASKTTNAECLKWERWTQ